MRHATRYLLDDEEQKVLKSLVEELGVQGAARKLDLTRGVVTAAAGGIGVLRGSLELVRTALAKHRGDDSGEV